MPASAFNASTLRKRAKTCRECQAAYQRRWYEVNREVQKERARRLGERHRASVADLLRDLKSRPCMDCGRRFPPQVMDFDHVRGVKVLNVSKFASRKLSLERLLEEVAKCDLVCANCHRIRTARRLEEAGKNVYWKTPERDEPGASAPGS